MKKTTLMTVLFMLSACALNISCKDDEKDVKDAGYDAGPQLPTDTGVGVTCIAPYTCVDSLDCAQQNGKQNTAMSCGNDPNLVCCDLRKFPTDTAVAPTDDSDTSEVPDGGDPTDTTVETASPTDTTSPQTVTDTVSVVDSDTTVDPTTDMDAGPDAADSDTTGTDMDGGPDGSVDAGDMATDTATPTDTADADAGADASL